MKIIYTSTVGSRMHGLHNANSDHDIRHIYISPIKKLISPFRSESVKVQENGKDIESWELNHFFGHLAKGNPTCYEVIKSDIYEQNAYATLLKSSFPYFYNTKAILNAHCGYANAQISRYLNPMIEDIDKERITAENFLRRIPKAIVAAYRVIAQGTQLIKNRDFICLIKDYDPILFNKLIGIKNMDASLIDSNFCQDHLAQIEEAIGNFKHAYDSLSDEDKGITPDIEVIEDLMYKIYTQ